MGIEGRDERTIIIIYHHCYECYERMKMCSFDINLSVYYI